MKHRTRTTRHSTQLNRPASIYDQVGSSRHSYGNFTQQKYSCTTISDDDVASYTTIHDQAENSAINQTNIDNFCFKETQPPACLLRYMAGLLQACQVDMPRGTLSNTGTVLGHQPLIRE